MATEPLGTAEELDHPCCRQLAVFVENRLGQLLRLTRVLEGDDVRILSVSVENAVDCAIVRLVVDQPETARKMITDAGFAVAESDVLVVEVPPGKRGILTVCAALISAEVNINFAYPLLAGKNLGSCLAIQVDNLPAAARALISKRFNVLDQSDL